MCEYRDNQEVRNQLVCVEQSALVQLEDSSKDAVPADRYQDESQQDVRVMCYDSRDGKIQLRIHPVEWLSSQTPECEQWHDPESRGGQCDGDNPNGEGKTTNANPFLEDRHLSFGEVVIAKCETPRTVSSEE